MEGQTGGAEPPSLDLGIISKHVLQATQLLLESGDYESLKKLIEEKAEIIKKFATDTTCRGTSFVFVFFIIKLSIHSCYTVVVLLVLHT